MKIQVRENFIVKKTKLPPLGLRIVKTGLAVFLCLLIYYFRSYEGMISQSCVAAIICIQPYRKESIHQSLIRVIGSLIGAFWGLFFLQMLRITPLHKAPILVIYGLMSIFVIVTLYSTVMMKQMNASGLAAIVFICIVVGYPNLEAPLMQTFHRMADTLIGIAVAGVVNSLSFPRTKHQEFLFFVRLQDLVPDRFSHISNRVLVMLNRLYEEGAKVCLVTRWAPAFLLSQVGTMNIPLPVIVMDGAALYDIENKRYIEVQAIPQETVHRLASVFRSLQIGYCIYAVQESNMFVYRRGIMNSMEEEDYQMMKRSPYRNYVSGDLAEGDQIVFLRIIDQDAKILMLEEQLHILLNSEMIRIERRKQPRLKGCSGLYFFHPDANVDNRKKDLLNYMKEHGEEKAAGVDLILQDSYRSEREAISLLNQIHSIYEPVDWLKFFHKKGKDGD